MVRIRRNYKVSGSNKRGKNVLLRHCPVSLRKNVCILHIQTKTFYLSSKTPLWDFACFSLCSKIPLCCEKRSSFQNMFYIRLKGKVLCLNRRDKNNLSKYNTGPLRRSDRIFGIRTNTFYGCFSPSTKDFHTLSSNILTFHAKQSFEKSKACIPPFRKVFLSFSLHSSFHSHCSKFRLFAFHEIFCSNKPRSRPHIGALVKRNISKNNISGTLLGLLDEQGANIEILAPVLRGGELQALREDTKFLSKKIQTEEAVLTCQVPSVTREVFSSVCSRKEKAKEDVASCRKFMLSYNFGVEQESLTPEFVLEYSGKEKIFENQSLAFSGSKAEQKKDSPTCSNGRTKRRRNSKRAREFLYLAILKRSCTVEDSFIG